MIIGRLSQIIKPVSTSVVAVSAAPDVGVLSSDAPGSGIMIANASKVMTFNPRSRLLFKFICVQGPFTASTFYWWLLSAILNLLSPASPINAAKLPLSTALPRAHAQVRVALVRGAGAEEPLLPRWHHPRDAQSPRRQVPVARDMYTK